MPGIFEKIKNKNRVRAQAILSSKKIKKKIDEPIGERFKPDAEDIMNEDEMAEKKRKRRAVLIQIYGNDGEEE